MSEQFTQATALQKYNTDLSRYIGNIKDNGDDLQEEVSKDEDEKALIEQEIQCLTERHA